MLARLPQIVSADYLEAAPSLRTRSDVTGITIDITDFRRSRVFAEARLLGLLMHARRRGAPVSVRLGSELPPFESGSGNKYWKLFTESISGFVLAQVATRIEGPLGYDRTHDVRMAQAQVLGGQKGILGSGVEVAAPIVDVGTDSTDTIVPPASQVVLQNDIRQFTGLFNEILFRRLGLAGIDSAAAIGLRDVAFEALQNTRDHGSTDLSGAPLPGIRFLTIRRINVHGDLVSDTLRNQSVEALPMAAYLEALTHYEGMGTKNVRRLVEITVADSGIGIPARMAGRESIYQSDIEQERAYLHQALRADGTSKPRSVAGAGLGLFKLLQQTHRLKGIVVFRTGHLYMSRHYLGGEPWPDLSLFDWSGHDGAFIAGSSVSVLFPLAPRRAPRSIETA